MADSSSFLSELFDIIPPPPPSDNKANSNLTNILSDDFFTVPPPPPPEHDFDLDFAVDFASSEQPHEDKQSLNLFLDKSPQLTSRPSVNVIKSSDSHRMSINPITTPSPSGNQAMLPPSHFSTAPLRSHGVLPASNTFNSISSGHRIRTQTCSPQGVSIDLNNLPPSNLSVTPSIPATIESNSSLRQPQYSGPVPAAWVSQQLSLRANETANQQTNLNIVCCSWNVNGKKPSANDHLEEWLTPLRHKINVSATQRVFSTVHTDTNTSTVVAPADILAVSFQEIVDLSAKNLLTDPNATGRWEERISLVLEESLQAYMKAKGVSWDMDEDKGYHIIASTHLVGLAMCVWVRTSLLHRMSNVRTGKVGVGIMGVGGNKGAVGVSLRIDDTSICLLNAHIAAHQHKVKDRNAHYHTILRRFKFDPCKSKHQHHTYTQGSNTYEPVPIIALSAIYNTNSTIHHVQRQAQSGSVQGLSELTVMDHDHVIWMGDLNYRLAHPDLEKVFQKIDQKDIPYLLHYDQLLTEKNAGRAFSAFIEPQITFLPSYKYTPGTHNYERRAGKKIRVPSFCDRIQYRSMNPAFLSSDAKDYTRAELTLSDHKPVSLSLSVTAHQQSRRKRNDLMLELKRQSALSVLPRLDISWTRLHWPQVRYNMPLHKSLTLHNPGLGVVRFAVLVCAPEETPMHDILLHKPVTDALKPDHILDTAACIGVKGKVGTHTQEDPITNLWLTVSPAHGLIAPGESVDVNVTTLVKGLEGHRCNLGQLPLFGRIIVRIQDACVRQWTEEIGPSEVAADTQMYVDNKNLRSLEVAEDDSDDESTSSEISGPTNVQSSQPLSGGQRALNKIKSIFSSNSEKSHVEDAHSVRSSHSTLRHASLQEEFSGPSPPSSLMHNYSSADFWQQQSRPIEYVCHVSGQYLPSVVGSSLIHLLSLQGPLRGKNQLNSYALVRRISIQQVAQRARAGSTQWSASLVPKEIVYLIESAINHPAGGALQCPDMFLPAVKNPNDVIVDESGLLSTALAPVDPVYVMKIRDILDTCPHLLSAAIEKYNIPLLASGHALIDVLNGLSEPILPTSIAVPMVQGDLTDWCRKLLLDLSSQQYNLFMYLMAFLKALIEPNHVIHTKLSAQSLTVLFAKPLTHVTDPHKAFNEAQSKSALHIIYHLLKIQ